MSEKKNRENSRIVGQLLEIEGKYGKMNSIHVNNPYPTNKDGGENKYHNGNLIWIDKKTGTSYMVKSLKMVNTEEKDFGKNKSVGLVCLELDNEFQVTKVDN